MGGRDVVGIGVIGTGKHGLRYIRHIRQDCPDLRLVGIARRDAARAAALAEELGCRAFPDYRALVADPTVDAVVVVVPPALNAEIVAAAAEAGKAVLLEKPAAVSLAAGRAMLAALAVHPIPLMVAQTLRYNAVVRALLAARDQIGPIHSVSLSQRFEPSRLPWIDRRELAGGGITLHTGVHSFDLLRVLTGRRPEQVACQMARIRTRETEDSFAAAISLDGGSVLATVSGARTAPGRTGHIELAGEAGTLVGDHVLHDARLVVGMRSEPLPLGEPVPTVRAVLQAFSRALRTGEPMPIPLTEGLEAVALAEACYRSAESGGRVPVERVA